MRSQVRHQLTAGDARHHEIGDQKVRLQPTRQTAIQGFLTAARVITV
jgi:hypothetical protein